MSVRLSKEESENLLDSRKETVKRVCLKKAEMNGLISRVAVVLDVSGSMTMAFQHGMVQAALERLLPLAMAFDDDGSMEVWTFNTEFKRYPPMTRGNFYNYLTDNNIRAAGATSYSPVLQDVCRFFISEEPAPLPTYVIFITDGDNNDHIMCDKLIKAASYFPLFFQFVGIGGSVSEFKYLNQLDNMDGRYVDNANFFAIRTLSDAQQISDSELYAKLLDEYPKWLSYPQVRQMLTEITDFSKERKKQLKILMKDYKSKFERKERLFDVAGAILDILEIFLDG